MDYVRIPISVSFTISKHTFDWSVSPPVPLSIDSSWNGATGAPEIQIFQGSTDVSANWTISVNGIAYSAGTPAGAVSANTDAGQSVANRYDITLTCNSGGGLFQVVMGVAVNGYSGSDTVATVQVGAVPLPASGSMPETGKTVNLPASPAAVGSQMDLVSVPNAAAVTSIAASIDARLSGDHGPGAWGANLLIDGVAVAVTVTNATNSPIDGMQIWLSSDPEGQNVLAGTFVTNSAGVAVFTCTPGDYSLWRQEAGFGCGTNPQSITVVANTPLNVTYNDVYVLSGTIPAPADVLLGVAVGNTTGTLIVAGTVTLPSPASVLAGINRGDGVLGTLVVPNAADVRFGVDVNGTTGLCYVPLPAQVLWGVQVDDSSVGTLGAVQIASLNFQPVNPTTGLLTLTIGDDYLAAIGRAVTFTDPLDGTWPASIHSALLTVRQNGNDSTAQLSITGSVVNGSNPRILAFDLPSAASAGLVPSLAAEDNSYAVTCYTTNTTAEVVTIYNDLPATIVKPLAE